MSNESNTLYQFGEFRLDTKERVLIRANETIILAPKVFDTLEVLVKNDGKIVSKDDLMNEIWEDSFVEEGNLTQKYLRPPADARQRIYRNNSASWLPLCGGCKNLRNRKSIRRKECQRKCNF